MAEYGDSDDDRPVVRLSCLLRAYPGCDGGPGHNYEAVYWRSPEVAMCVACSRRPSGASAVAAVAAFKAPPLHCNSSDVAVIRLRLSVFLQVSSQSGWLGADHVLVQHGAQAA
jgi:hypothetical protein